MSLKRVTPCDYSGFCPYNAESSYHSCEYWCGEPEPNDSYEEEEEEE